MDFAEDASRAGRISVPDIMNDPAYATNSGVKGKHGEEMDTCRICRAEGSEEEQLFYPCKCSGSIKFVHQPCLMEWLSHSQKKYCELCKTPFRFTKLYDPDMPQELPAPVFAKELFFHAARTVLTWMRFALVAFVWLGWLPWSMRAIWRGLFWLADGRWPNSSTQQSRLSVAMENRLSQLAANGTTPVQHALASNSPAVSSAAQNVADALPQILSPVSSMLNFSDDEPMIFSVAKKIFQIAFVSSSAGLSDPNSANTTAPAVTRQRQPSWLSDVSFLNNLTPSATFNNVIIDTLEGQLITLLVVISFILVFLIREWVVQQQPGVNIENDGDVAAQLLAGVNANHVAEAGPQEAGAAEPVQDQNQEPDSTQRQETDGMNHNDERELDHIIRESQSQDVESSARTNTDSADPGYPVASRSTSRPGLQSRNALDDASHIRRTIEEASTVRGHQRYSEIDILKDLWTRGSGNPAEIIKIIEREGQQEELAWVVSAMNNLQRINNSSDPDFTERLLLEEESSSSSNPEPMRDDPSPTTMGPLGLPRAPPPRVEDPPENRGNSGSNSISTAPRETPSFGDLAEPFTFTHEPPAGSWETGESSRTRNMPQNNLSARGEDGGSGIFDFSHPEQHDDSDQTVSPNISDQSHPNDSAIDPASDVTASSAVENPGDTLPEESTDSDAPPQGLVERVADWFWGGVPPPELAQNALENDNDDTDHPDQEPLPPAGNQDLREERPEAGNQRQDPELAGDDAEEGEAEPNDAEAIDDADDLEGVMELIGMQGPIFGLLQNGVFSALLVSFTVAVGIWLPYLWGKIALVFLTNPVRLFIGAPLAILSLIVDVALDSLIGCLGYVVYGVNVILKLALGPMTAGLPWLNNILKNTSVTATSLSLISGSSHRLKRVAEGFFSFKESDLPMFSVISHQALHIHEARFAKLFQISYQTGKFILYDFPLLCIRWTGQRATGVEPPSTIEFSQTWHSLTETLFNFIKSPLFFLQDSQADNNTHETPSFDYDLAHWDTKDRIIAIIVGYIFAFLAGLFYLRVVRFMSQMNRGQRFDGVIADVLHQAGGVMKVILIIGIEMIVFPLYCGLLLDFSLMPLFENATVASRVAFTVGSPLTSLFVHWFVGTCYMFHFALFVSMCRKVMRSGVLYFIRDPDDPTFHPVRDVLERNVATQLRKIAFSAMVYGALVIFCLGGVVWGLSFAFEGVLPIHWSSNEPVLEFPVDLLFYNFVMPVAIRWIRPSDGLQDMYDWWFHKCARFLRLTNFLFGDRWADEEGRHVHTTWGALLSGKKGDTENPVIPDGDKRLDEEQKLDAYFLRDGRFVRTPASDQVRIPKGGQVFVEVNENGERIDGKPDQDDGLHGKKNDMFKKVYIPPYFRFRICFFIFLIWAFAATTGVGTTIVPLVIGRRMISSLFPSHLRVNDIYAFSAGIYVFGGICYAIYHCRQGIELMKDRLRPFIAEPRRALPEAYSMALRALRLLYLSATFSLLLPSLFALVMELYVLVPLHTYIADGQEHVIYFVQDWTLGVLYVRMAVKFILWHSTSRPALALNAITRNGWFDPDVKLATRAFIVPAVSLALLAILSPLPFGFLANATIFRGATAAVQSNVYRYSYPSAFVVGLILWFFYLLRLQLGIWRVSIRDDVYLVGERLHNFGEKRAKDVGAARRMITS